MRRISVPIRSDWRERLCAVGMTFHTIDDEPYWSEGTAYVLTPAEAERIEDAAAELHRLCLRAVDAVVRGRRFAEFALPPAWWPAIERSWETEAESYLYGRFDLAPDARGVPRMLEYNADTPTALLEASVAQWHWLEDQRELAPGFAGADQFNSIHERLQERFRALGIGPWAFACHTGSDEDALTAAYLQDVARASAAPRSCSTWRTSAGTDAASPIARSIR